MHVSQCIHGIAVALQRLFYKYVVCQIPIVNLVFFLLLHSVELHSDCNSLVLQNSEIWAARYYGRDSVE